jgi:hypothetical protein
MKTITRSGLAVKTGLKAGLSGTNHNRGVIKSGLAVRSAVTAGLGGNNHNRALLV